jgi:hypothetical protein
MRRGFSGKTAGATQMAKWRQNQVKTTELVRNLA